MFEVHTVERPDGSQLAKKDRAMLGGLSDVANAAGSGAGTAVTTSVSLGKLPANYRVHVTPNQACFVNVINKTDSGFDVVLTPKDGSTTLSAGTFDVTVEA